jgi:hypothetical protein
LATHNTGQSQQPRPDQEDCAFILNGRHLIRPSASKLNNEKWIAATANTAATSFGKQAASDHSTTYNSWNYSS